MIVKKLFVVIFLFISLFVNAQDKTFDYKSENPNSAQYEKEKLSYSFKKEFDEMYPVDIKRFTFKQGDKEISFKELVTITQDTGLLKNTLLLKKTKITGLTAGIILGSLSVGFLIPSVIFLAKETNYYLIPDNYVLTGIAMVVLAGLSAIALVIDLVVTFSLMYKYKYNEKTIQQAIDTYNEKLARKYKIIPDISYLMNSFLFCGVKIKI